MMNHTTDSKAMMCRYIQFSLAFVLISLIATSNAYAVGAALCTMISVTMGTGLARAIATVGVLMVGVGATLGRMSWTLAITVAVGVAGMYSATSIAMSLGSTGGCFGT